MTARDLTVDRRTLLATSTVGAGVALTGTLSIGSAEAAAANRYFKHGVASGDPRPRRIVLWTRVTPTKAATPGSRKGPQVAVTWQVAKDRRFRTVVSHGKVRTGPGKDHTVKVDAKGLRPATDYYYRFLYAGVSSPVGRTRTAPRKNANVDHVRFGVVSCSNLPAGYFSAYRHLARRDDLDAILHLGDYIYEYGSGEYGELRQHVPAHEMVSLADYRQRHAQYKQDRDLQALHARHPFIVTWDDHEVTNDAWAAGAENHQPATEGDYRVRRAAAHRAYDEWMPVRMSGTAKVGDGTKLFRRLRFGKLAELSMLDLRTYRSQQVTGPIPPDPEASNPDRTITGKAQMRWLKRSLRNDRALWKLVGNPVMIAPVLVPPLPTDVAQAINSLADILPSPLPEDGAPYNVDQWDGYTADRRELFAHLRDQGVKNTVFLTGDIHSGWACDLPVDAGSYPLRGGSVGTEFVCTSVTSDNLDEIVGSPRRTTSLVVEAALTTANRHIKYLNFDDHGFSVFDVNRERAQMDYFVISDRTDPDATAVRSASWATTVNSHKVHAVDRGVDA